MASDFISMFCCQDTFNLWRVERCAGGDVGTMFATVTEGLFERSVAFAQSGIDLVNTASSVAYISADEEFWNDIDLNMSGYYVEWVLPNGKSEFYLVNNTIQARDLDACCTGHYELELSRVKRPVACQEVQA